MFEVSCVELNVEGCDFVARGETPDQLAEAMLEHLHEEHDFDIDTEDLRNPDEVEKPVERMLLHRLRDLVLAQVPTEQDL